MAVDLAARLAEPLVLVYGAEPPGGPGEEFRAHQQALAEIGRTAVEHAVAEADTAGVRTIVEVLDEKPPRRPSTQPTGTTPGSSWSVPAARAPCEAPSSDRCRTSCCRSATGNPPAAERISAPFRAGR